MAERGGQSQVRRLEIEDQAEELAVQAARTFLAPFPLRDHVRGHADTNALVEPGDPSQLFGQCFLREPTLDSSIPDPGGEQRARHETPNRDHPMVPVGRVYDVRLP